MFDLCNVAGTWLGDATQPWRYHPKAFGLPAAVLAKSFHSDVPAGLGR